MLTPAKYEIALPHRQGRGDDDVDDFQQMNRKRERGESLSIIIGNWTMDRRMISLINWIHNVEIIYRLFSLYCERCWPQSIFHVSPPVCFRRHVSCVNAVAAAFKHSKTWHLNERRADGNIFFQKIKPSRYNSLRRETQQESCLLRMCREEKRERRGSRKLKVELCRRTQVSAKRCSSLIILLSCLCCLFLQKK